MTKLHKLVITPENEQLWLNIVKDDPVIKENLNLYWRTVFNREIWYIKDYTGAVSAVVSVAFVNKIPKWYNDILDRGNILCCYSLWSYRKGAGSELISAIENEVSTNLPDITLLITLSPQTEMAKNFHIKNGAFIYRNNEKTVNFCYPISTIAEMV